MNRHLKGIQRRRRFRQHGQLDGPGLLQLFGFASVFRLRRVRP